MVICINFHFEFDSIHAIYFFTCRLLSSKSKMNIIHSKSDDNATPINYLIVNKWMELALARHEIVSRFLRAARDF